MMKTTMPSAIMMVELAASMKLMDGIITAQIVSAKSVHHLDGMAMASVMMVFSILIIVNGTVEIVVEMFKHNSALNANVLIHHFQPPQLQPQQLQLQPQPLLHHQRAVGPLVGPRINGAMMRTTMLNAIGMVELVVSMTSVDGTPIAMI